MSFLGNLVVSFLMTAALVSLVVGGGFGLTWVAMTYGPIPFMIFLGSLVFCMFWASAYEHIKKTNKDQI